MFHLPWAGRKRRKGKLRLDVEAEAKADVIVAGKLADSEFWARITSTDADQLMPPAKAKNANAQRSCSFKRWIEQGAKYEGHWALSGPRLQRRQGHPEMGQTQLIILS